MTTLTEPDTPSCRACGSDRLGRYCHRCGQDSHDRPRPLRDWIAEAFSEANLVDGKTARTLVALVIAPVRLLDAYRSGAGGRYQSLTKLFIVAAALFLIALNVSGVAVYQYVAEVVDRSRPVLASADPDGSTVHLVNVTSGERWMQRLREPAIDPEVSAAISTAARVADTERDRQNLLYENQLNAEQAIVGERLAAWLPNALWLLMPLFALLLIPLFGRRRPFTDHLVFAMWAHVIAFALLSVTALANGMGAGLPAAIVGGPYLLIVASVARRYYALTILQAGWRTVIHTGVYLVFAVLPAAIAVAAASMDLAAFAAYLAVV